MKKHPSNRRPRLKPGDLISIPRQDGGYYFVLYITTNRFGYAFGLLRGYEKTGKLPLNWEPVPFGSPIYTDIGAIRNGSWKAVGNYQNLLALFSNSPPIYHSKYHNADNDKVGQYGSAEEASGALRDLSKEEAERLGLDVGINRSIMICEQLEYYLQSLFG